MRWNSVKKTAQWAVFRNSPEGFSLRVRDARSAARNPLQATMISEARSDERTFLFSLHDARGGDAAALRVVVVRFGLGDVMKERRPTERLVFRRGGDAMGEMSE